MASTFYGRHSSAVRSDRSRITGTGMQPCHDRFVIVAASTHLATPPKPTTFPFSNISPIRWASDALVEGHALQQASWPLPTVRMRYIGENRRSGLRPGMVSAGA
jgi:hypothetical protein